MYNISLHSLIQQNIQISRKRRERWNKDVPDNPEEGEVKSSEVIQSCLTLCDPMDCSLSGSSVHEIFQARVLEWIAISFSRGSPRPRKRTRVFRIAGRRFTVWATSEAPNCPKMLFILVSDKPWTRHASLLLMTSSSGFWEQFWCQAQCIRLYNEYHPL